MNDETPRPAERPKLRIEKTPRLDETMARLQSKMDIAGREAIKGFDAGILNSQREEIIRRYEAMMPKTDPVDYRSLMPDPATNPVHRTAKAAEAMTSHLQLLAEAALRSEKRADEAEARADRLEKAQQTEHSWNRANTMFAALAAVASIVAIVIAIILA